MVHLERPYSSSCSQGSNLLLLLLLLLLFTPANAWPRVRYPVNSWSQQRGSVLTIFLKEGILGMAALKPSPLMPRGSSPPKLAPPSLPSKSDVRVDTPRSGRPQLLRTLVTCFSLSRCWGENEGGKRSKSREGVNSALHGNGVESGGKCS